MKFNPDLPIWQQIYVELVRRIVTGFWPAGSRMNSVREIAAEVGANPNTAQKALMELEREGLVFSDRTSGRYVTDNQSLIAQARQQQAHWQTWNYLEAIVGLGLSEAEITELIHQVYLEVKK